MNAQDTLINVLSGYASGLPVYLVWFAGLIYALVTWRRHPGVSALAASALLMQLLVSVVFVAVTRTVPQMLQEKGELNSLQIASLYSAFGLGQSCLSAIAYTLLICAVFKGRKSVATPA